MTKQAKLFTCVFVLASVLALPALGGCSHEADDQASRELLAAAQAVAQEASWETDAQYGATQVVGKDAADRMKVCVSNKTGYAITQLSAKPAGAENSKDYLGDGQAIQSKTTFQWNVVAASAKDATYDIALTMKNGTACELKDVPLATARNLQLHYKDEVGYVTYKTAKGKKKSTYAQQMELKRQAEEAARLEAERIAAEEATRRAAEEAAAQAAQATSNHSSKKKSASQKSNKCLKGDAVLN